MSNLLKVRTLTRLELNLLIKLRSYAQPGSRVTVPRSAEEKLVRKLVLEAKRAGMTLHAPKSAFVSDDEASILASMSLFQRSLPGEDEPDNELLSVIRVYALLLNQDGRRLPSREHFPNRLVPIATFDSAREETSDPPPAPRSLPAPGTLKRALIDQLLIRDSMNSREIMRLGISRIYLAVLLNEGLLERLPGNRYRLRASTLYA